MALSIVLSKVRSIAPGVWATELSPADVRRLGEARFQIAEKSVIGVSGAKFSSSEGELAVDPATIYVLNVGLSQDAIVLDLGSNEKFDVYAALRNLVERRPLGGQGELRRGDQEFLNACRQELLPDLVRLGEQLLERIRSQYPGELHEGLARKWVNYPDNFFAMTIQNRDQSFAIHVRGRADRVSGSSLDVRPDRGSYCRFKITKPSQLDDALRAILQSANT